MTNPTTFLFGESDAPSGQVSRESESENKIYSEVRQLRYFSIVCEQSL